MIRPVPNRLYFYAKQRHADTFLREGLLSFGPCQLYQDVQLTAAQRDIEHQRSSSLSGPGLRILTGPNSNQLRMVPNVTSVEITANLPLYFIRSLSRRADSGLLEAFGAEVCVEITDPCALLRRCAAALDGTQLLGDWRFVADYVTYRRPDEPLPTDDDALRFLKDESYAAQEEFRLVLIPEFRYVLAHERARENLFLGSAADICRLVEPS